MKRIDESQPGESNARLSQAQQDRLSQIFSGCPLVPVITIEDPEQAVPLGKALYAGGLKILEITLRTRHGLGAIKALREALPEAWVGAGTVTTVGQYRAAEAAGAQFVITPGTTRELLDEGIRNPVPLLPGVATVSEILLGYGRGYRGFKFFPAEVAGGIPALNAFAAPLTDVYFCPTGGIRKETAAQYLALGNVRAVGGTWMTPRNLLQKEDWAGLTRLAGESLALCQQSPPPGWDSPSS